MALPCEQAAKRIEVLCSTLSPDVAVPACPEWTARELIAHLAGLTEDWVAGDLEPYASPEWTSRQVARFAGRRFTLELRGGQRARFAQRSLKISFQIFSYRFQSLISLAPIG